MLGIVFAKSRLTYPITVSIEHMRRINGYNTLHYIRDRFVWEGINIRDPNLCNVPKCSTAMHVYFFSPSLQLLNNTDKADETRMLHVDVIVCLDNDSRPAGLPQAYDGRGHQGRQLLAYSLRRTGAEVEGKVSTSKVTLPLRPHLQPDKPIVTANKTILILQVATGLCILLIRIKHLSLSRPRVCRC